MPGLRDLAHKHLTWYPALEGVESDLPGAVGTHHGIGKRHEVLGLPEPVFRALTLLLTALLYLC